MNNEIQTESTLFAEPIAHIGGFTITNSLLSSWATVIILVILFISIGKKIKKIPRGLQNIFEIILEQALQLADRTLRRGHAERPDPGEQLAGTASGVWHYRICRARRKPPDFHPASPRRISRSEFHPGSGDFFRDSGQCYGNNYGRNVGTFQ